MYSVKNSALNFTKLSFRLRPMDSTDRDQVLRLRVEPAQAPFVEPIEETLACVNTLRENHVMLIDDKVIGFFQIDLENEQRFEVASAKELELHEVIIDSSHQGRGYGAAFLEQLPAYIGSEYPGWKSIVLTVNCLNERAHALYKRGGFSDTGEIYPHGRSGPQYVMRYFLADT